MNAKEAKELTEHSIQEALTSNLKFIYEVIKTKASKYERQAEIDVNKLDSKLCHMITTELVAQGYKAEYKQQYGYMGEHREDRIYISWE